MPFCLVEFLLVVGLEIEDGLTLLIGRSLDFDLVILHDLFCSLTQRRRFTILASSGEIDRRDGERIAERRSLNTRTACSSPSRYSSLDR
jgi:hypothetical protein